MAGVEVLRLSHRVVRDKRITTHLALTARAFLAKGMYYSGDRDRKLESSIEKVVDEWGGSFFISHVESPKALVKEKKKAALVIHLTMYGLPLKEVIDKLRGKPLLVVVGGEKVERFYYEEAHYNVSITNQPISEVSALAVFLHELFEGKELSYKFKGKKEVIPSERNKIVRQAGLSDNSALFNKKGYG